MQHEPKKIALFVDFDNIFLGLRETSREAAEAFATKPHQWLKWIENGMPMDSKAEHAGPKESRVLIRRCYLNPGTFGKYRVWFTRAGFSVVDCPPLTSQGKNSADIMMVMDMMDALRHETRFDRFVIMSADADFTPVLQRLRAHDRRTAVLVSGQAALAYRASCDRVITEDAFIEHALEIAPPPEPLRAPPAPPTAAALREPELLSAMGRRIYEEASSSGTLSASELPRILREFKEFTPTSNWLGYYSLQSLTEAILAHRTDLRITDDDPWRIAVQGADEPAASANGGAPAAPAAEAPGAELGRHPRPRRGARGAHGGGVSRAGGDGPRGARRHPGRGLHDHRDALAGARHLQEPAAERAGAAVPGGRLPAPRLSVRSRSARGAERAGGGGRAGRAAGRDGVAHPPHPPAHGRAQAHAAPVPRAVPGDRQGD